MASLLLFCQLSFQARYQTSPLYKNRRIHTQSCSLIDSYRRSPHRTCDETFVMTHPWRVPFLDSILANPTTRAEASKAIRQPKERQRLLLPNYSRPTATGIIKILCPINTNLEWEVDSSMVPNNRSLPLCKHQSAPKESVFPKTSQYQRSSHFYSFLLFLNKLNSTCHCRLALVSKRWARAKIGLGLMLQARLTIEKIQAKEILSPIVTILGDVVHETH